MSDLPGLVARAEILATQAYVPYSDRPSAALVLLADGKTVPGVAVESASFSLTIPALMNAVTTAYAVGRRDIVAAVMSRPLTDAEAVYLAGVTETTWHALTPQVMVATPDLPEPVGDLDPFLARVPTDRLNDVAAAREASKNAYIPASAFPVGCVLVTDDGRALPGVNVEHPDWSRILCAERNALGTAVTFGVQNIERMIVSCPRDDAGSPCGACRQLIAELAPDAEIWMDRGQSPAERFTPAQLLPFAFSGRTLRF